MDDILYNYKLGKFKKCLELIKLLPDNDDFTLNFVHENSLLVCESIVIVLENDVDNMLETQEKLFLFYDKVTSVDSIVQSIPLQLKLTVTFNLFYWLLFYNNNSYGEMNVTEEDYFEIINNGLLRVLERQVSPSECCELEDKIIDNLFSLKRLTRNKDHKTVLLILELIIVVLLYIIKLKRTLIQKCKKVVSDCVLEFNQKLNGLSSIDEYMEVEVEKVPLLLLKFGLNKINHFVAELDSNIIDYLYILESTLLFLMGDFKKSLKALKHNINCSVKGLWNYLGMVNSFELEQWDLCLGFLVKSSDLIVEYDLKGRYHIMWGKLQWCKRNHKEALKYFQSALNHCENCPSVYYYIGQEYGKMGLYDMMTENFEKLVEAVCHHNLEADLPRNFENILLQWIHPLNEITNITSLYALAVSYALDERFSKSSETFGKLLDIEDVDNIDLNKGIIQMPNFLTVLHEAATINLLAGNLVKAEQLALDAAERYVPQDTVVEIKPKSTNFSRDIGWLQMTIEQELLESDLEPKELSNQTIYYEDVIFCFSENIMALLILSEIQRIQEVDEYKITLNKILSIFSKYLASMCKKEVVSDRENYVWTLVKALAGKTCLRIAAVLSKQKDSLNIEIMYKRALSSNKGDKDALYYYYNFLVNGGRKKEALKLWRTFYKNQSVITIDDVQSLALRYFLVNKITKRELEKIETDIQFLPVELS